MGGRRVRDPRGAAAALLERVAPELSTHALGNLSDPGPRDLVADVSMRT